MLQQSTLVQNLPVHSTTLTPECEEQLLSYMMEKIRPLAYHHASLSHAYDTDEYVSSAMEHIFIMMRKGHTDTPYLFGVARNVMKWLDRGDHPISLDAWMYDEGTGMQRDIADTHEETRQSSLALRRQVLKMLRRLNKKQRAVVMSYYHISPPGRCAPSKEWTMTRHHLSKSQYSSIRISAIDKLYFTR